MKFSVIASLLFSAMTCSSEPRADNDFAPFSPQENTLSQVRTATGQPSAHYWQQQVDYDIQVTLRTATSTPNGYELLGKAHVTYHNNSPQVLPQLYFLLDHNALKPYSLSNTKLALQPNNQAVLKARAEQARGFQIDQVMAGQQPLIFHVSDTLLQVTLAQPLPAGETTTLTIDWQLLLTDKVATGARSGVEWLDDASPIVLAAQWFPRATAFTDYGGWQLKPFLQQGEFSTEYGNYSVAITVPENFTVAATGESTNLHTILNPDQLAAAQSLSDEWVIDRQAAQARRQNDRAIKAQSKSSHAKQTWLFRAEQVRDFAFAASPSFLWRSGVDSQGRRLNSFFPVEAESLWAPFGLAAMRHTLTQFDAALFTLPYNTLNIVNAAGLGMEYPALSSIATRPERRVSSTQRPAYDAVTKYDFIGSVIHEVGHNYLPMNINTDEREWAWLDEGLISFLEYRVEHRWEANFDVIYGEPRTLPEYLQSSRHQPVMTPADDLTDKIANAYNKAASNLNLLRTLVLGPDAFDNALRTFAQTWMGKRPTPGDFFNAMAQASHTDLTWFWRSWFLEARELDWAVTNVSRHGVPLEIKKSDNQPEPPVLFFTQYTSHPFVVDQQPNLADIYSQKSPGNFSSDESKQRPDLISSPYRITIANYGSALLPVPVELHFSNGKRRTYLIPVQAWQGAKREQDHSLRISWQPAIQTLEKLTAIYIDPLWLTPDGQRDNNAKEILYR